MICTAKNLTYIKLNSLAGLYQNTVNTSDEATYFESCPINYAAQIQFKLLGRRYANSICFADLARDYFLIGGILGS